MRSRRRNFKRKKFIIISIFVLAIFMSVAYAAFQSELTILSASKIFNECDTQFTNASLLSSESTLKVNSAGMAEEIFTPVISEDGLSMEVGVILNSPDDRMSYEIEITNFSKGLYEEFLGIDVEYLESDPYILWAISGVEVGDIIDIDSTIKVTLIAYWNYEKSHMIPDDAISKDSETEENQTHTENATINLKLGCTSADAGVITPELPEATAEIVYSTTNWTNESVISTISFDQDDIKIINNNGKEEYTFTKNGSYQFKYGDSLGRQNTIKANVDWIDKTAPSITSVGNPKENVWTNQSVTLAPTANDTGSGFDKYLWNIDGGEWQEGFTGVFTENINATIGLMAIDKVGNKSNPVYTKIKINKTVPVISLKGANEITLNVFDIYNEEGATAIDSYGIDITKDIVVTGTVNTSAIGTYYVKYNVIDSASNIASEVTRKINVVDTVKPALKVYPRTLNLSQFDTYDLMSGVTATDNYDQDITSKVVVTPSSSNWNVVTASTITRVFTYSITDSSGNTTTAERTITMIDREAPVITINPANLYVMEVDTTTDPHNIPEFNATATDNVDSSVNVVITHDINPKVVGTYTVTFTSRDAARNVKVETKSFTVRDTTRPVITLTSPTTITFEVHDEYLEPGYSAFDHYDGTITNKVVTTTNVNMRVVGTYWVRYNVTDANGNIAAQLTRTVRVVDTTRPIITIDYPDGKNYAVVERGAAYTLMDKVSASDNYDGNITNKIVRSHNILDTSHLGMYYVTYDVTDVNGNAAIQATKAIKVSTKPVITVTGASSMEVNTPLNPHSLPTLSATAVDSLGASVPVVITGLEGININLVGTYPVTYTATDVDGKVQTVVQNFQVRDTQKPFFNFLGEQYIEIGVGEGFKEVGWSAWDYYTSYENIKVAIEVTDAHGRVLSTGTHYGTNDGSSVTTPATIPSDYINTAGVYFFYYTVTELSGNNSQTYRREVVIYDNNLPALTLLLTNVYTMEVNTKSNPHGIPSLGATATDYLGNPIDSQYVKVTHDININVPGTYTVTFTATDPNTDRVRTQTMPFRVLHTRGPVITLNGNASMTVYSNSTYGGATTYTEPGATAFDDYDEDSVSVVITGNVNTTKPGTYTVTYTATDSANNTTSRTRTVNVVDNTSPVISFETNPLIIIQNDPADVMTGVSAMDNVDGNITSKVMATPITISTSWPGYFNISYSVRDSSNNLTTISRQIRVIDVIPPVITINPSNIYVMEVSTSSALNTIPKFNVSATDNVDSSVEVEITHDIKPDVVGTYKVTFTATDAHGNKTVETRDFTVRDTTKPVLTVTPATMSINQGTTFDLMSGVSAIDNYDGNITLKVGVNPPSSDWNVLNSSTITRVFTYSVTDLNGNVSTATRTITMIDKEKPVITPNPMNTYIMEVNTSSDSHNIPPFNASSTDNVDSSVEVEITHNINRNVVGTYPVTFTAIDKAGNITVETEDFIVRDTKAPVITVENTVETIEVHSSFNAKTGVSAYDYYDLDVTEDIEITGTVNPSEVGEYHLYYNVKDSSNNSATQVMKTIHVVDTTKPVLIVNPTTMSLNQGSTFDLMSGVSAIDNYDLDITDKVEITPSESDWNVVTASTITRVFNYKVTDKNGNESVATRTITMIDKEKPVITPNPMNTYIMEVNTSGDSHNIPSLTATATDNVDSNVTVQITNDINRNVVGTYTVTFTATDTAGNKTVETEDFIVRDTKAPVIALENTIETIEVHSSFNAKAGVSAYDYYDLDVTEDIEITGTVNPSEVGEYHLYYNVKDSSNNSATQMMKTIHVVDTTNPVITPNPMNTYIMEVNTSSDSHNIPEFNATATDNVDSSVDVKVTHNINRNVVGIYTVTFTATDTEGNTTIEAKQFTVQDTKAPVITVENNEETIEVHSPFNAKTGVSAYDYYDLDVTEDIEITGTINPSEVGEHHLYYNVKDSSNNSATQVMKTIHVVDTTRPVLTVTPATMNLNQGTTFDLMSGVSAIDNYDGNITLKVGVNPPSSDWNVLNSSTITRVFTYSVTDLNGNESTATRTITMIDKEKPVITQGPTNIYIMEVNTSSDSHTIPSLTATATDNVDSSVEVEITHNINRNVVGTYPVTFTSSDTAGNKTVETEDFIVRDTKAPVITVENNEETIEVHSPFNAKTGVSAYDYYDLDVTEDIEITGTVNPSEVGEYHLYYNVKDSSNNSATQMTKTIHVVDITKPVLTVTPATMSLNQGATFDLMSGVSAIDNYDLDITNKVEITPSESDWNVVTASTITRVFTYLVTDKNGNESTATRTITMVDKEKPVITQGPTNIYIMEVNTSSDSHTIPSLTATATDNVDSSVEAEVTHNINRNVVGTYPVTFTATDNAGNITVETEDFIVRDTKAPVITVENTEETIEVHSSFNAKAGVSAYDYYDLDVTDDIEISGTINPSVVGEYHLYYNVKDSSNNSAIQVMKTIHVVDTTKPEITPSPTNIYSMSASSDSSDIPDFDATALDNYDATVSVDVSHDIIHTTPGTYTITFVAQDSSGNIATITRSFIVI